MYCENSEVYSSATLPELMPELMKTWLARDDAIFSGLPAVDDSGLLLAYQEAFHPDDHRNSSEQGPKRMVSGPFCWHRSHSKRLLKFDSIAEFGDSQTSCLIEVRWIFEETSSRLTTTLRKSMLRIYVVRVFQSCRSLICNRSCRHAIAQGPKLKWIRPIKRNL